MNLNALATALIGIGALLVWSSITARPILATLGLG